ncbi:lysostaphin resistance A-like protein [Aerosakkonemataceae cyanobacterium BLCC-F50]|uniref:Lysostaphin resistance A-like protein n=1 Tax=Floridaenema flaviceps BLCC-F50 TaxID=3153642 RepID=A0ABV4XN38_9CYAN
MLVFYTEPIAPVKIIVFFLAWLGCWLPIAIPIAYALKWYPPKPLGAAQKIPLLASLYLIAPPLLWGFARVEGVSFLDYGISGDANFLISLGIGLAIGVISIIVVFAIESTFGWINWHWQPDRKFWETLLTTLLLGLWVSGTEELIFRGFLLNELQQSYSLWLGAVVSSLIFALLHLVWEIDETLPQLPGLFLMGLVLVLARWVDNGNLSLAIGLHAGWIWGLTTIDSAQLISYTGKGSAWFTGKNGKPLAGAAGIFCLLITGTLLLYLGREFFPFP